MRRFGVVLALVATMSLVVWQDPAQANHKWGKYHWSQSVSPFPLSVIDSTTNSPIAWSTYLSSAVTQWDQSTVVTISKTSSGSSTRSTCDPTLGKVRVCNYAWGATGWLGLAQIWIYVGGDGHIAQGIAELNDSYFNGDITYAYANSNEEKHVVCQEFGHTLGLDHQSTDGSSLNTCMDYYHNTNTSTLSTAPNQGDYDELFCIYDPLQSGHTITNLIDDGQGGTYTHSCTGTGHLDTSSKRGGGPGGGGGPGPGGGPPHPSDPSVTVRQVGQFWLITFILWK
jgi:hypothetical protein